MKIISLKTNRKKRDFDEIEISESIEICSFWMHFMLSLTKQKNMSCYVNRTGYVCIFDYCWSIVTIISSFNLSSDEVDHHVPLELLKRSL